MYSSVASSPLWPFQALSRRVASSFLPNIFQRHCCLEKNDFSLFGLFYCKTPGGIFPILTEHMLWMGPGVVWLRSLGLHVVQMVALRLLTYALKTVFLVCHSSSNVCGFILLYKNIYIHKTCIWSWMCIFSFMCIYYSGLFRKSFST